MTEAAKTGWPTTCKYCGAGNPKYGQTADWTWVQFDCGTEFEAEDGELGWNQDDECRIAALEAQLAEAKAERDRLAGALVGATVDYDHMPYQSGDEGADRIADYKRGVYVLDAQAVDDIAQTEQWEEAVTWRSLVEENESLTAQLAEAGKELTNCKEAAEGGMQFFHDVGTLLAPDGDRKSFTDADVLEWAAALRTERDGLREAIMEFKRTYDDPRWMAINAGDVRLLLAALLAPAKEGSDAK